MSVLPKKSRAQKMADCIRVLAMDAVQAANSGHPGMPMGMADAATVLFTKFLKFDPADPHWADRDRFVFEASHGLERNRIAELHGRICRHFKIIAVIFFPPFAFFSHILFT